MLNNEEHGIYKEDERQATPSLKNERPLDDYRAQEEFQIYEALCRGEQTQVGLI